MKYQYLIALLLLSRLATHAQTTGKEITLNNKLLQIELTRYLAYTQEWAQQQKVEGYIVKMQSESSGTDYTTFKLGVILADTEIKNFNPSFFTLINNKAVLIKSGQEAFFKTDTLFINVLMARFGKGVVNGERYRNDQLAEHQAWLKEQPDSVSLVTANGIKKVPASEMKPIIKDVSAAIKVKRPQTWELVFRKDQLEQVKQYD